MRTDVVVAAVCRGRHGHIAAVGPSPEPAGHRSDRLVPREVAPPPPHSLVGWAPGPVLLCAGHSGSPGASCASLPSSA